MDESKRETLSPPSSLKRERRLRCGCASRLQRDGAQTQLAIAENLRAQTAASFQEIFRARRERAIHPVTRRALLRSAKTNALNLEFLVDELVQINAACDHIAPRQSRRAIV